MRYYISGSIRDIERVRRIMEGCRYHGGTITHDWTQYTGPKDSLEEATRQILGIRSCNTFVLVVHPQLKAGWMEMGVAVELARNIVVVPHAEVSASMWYAFPSVHVLQEAEPYPWVSGK
jgi:hypothetical protein